MALGFTVQGKVLSLWTSLWIWSSSTAISKTALFGTLERKWKRRRPTVISRRSAEMELDSLGPSWAESGRSLKIPGGEGVDNPL